MGSHYTQQPQAPRSHRIGQQRIQRSRHQNEITGGISQITGNFTAEDTKDLANVLKSGKMPAPAKIVQSEMVGPSLGAASIQAGFTACIVAFVLLMIFMCVVYGFIPGMVANGA